MVVEEELVLEEEVDVEVEDVVELVELVELVDEEVEVEEDVLELVVVVGWSAVLFHAIHIIVLVFLFTSSEVPT